MDATAWTVVAATIALLAAVGASFRSLRRELRAQARRIDAQGAELRRRIDDEGEELRRRIDAQGKETGGQMGLLRERMAHLEGLLEGLREAITGKRVA